MLNASRPLAVRVVKPNNQERPRKILTYRTPEKYCSHIQVSMSLPVGGMICLTDVICQEPLSRVSWLRQGLGAVWFR